MPARRGSDGFTLVELLVSLALLGFVVAVLSGALQFARATWDAGAKLDRHAGYDMAESFLRARLSEAMPLLERATDGAVRIAFSGASDTLNFVAPAPNGPNGAGLYLFGLRVAQRSSQHALVVQLAPYEAERADTAGDERVLMANLRSLGIRYYGRNGQQAQPAWHDVWSGADALPMLIEITLVHEEGTLRLTVELNLRVRRP
jgi:prepilin-type N-terminal cleavage/methylation domain-containing protein